MAALVLVCLSLLIVCGLLLYCSESRIRRPFLLTLSIYSFLFFLLPAVFHINENVFPFFNDSFSQEDLLGASLVVFVFYSVFSVSYLYFDRSVPFDCLIKEFSGNFYEFDFSRGLVASVSGLVIGIFAGVDYFVTTRGDSESLVISPLLLIGLALARALGFFGFICILLLFLRSRRLIYFVGLVFSLFIFIFLNNPLVIPRYLLGAYIFVFVFLFFDILGRRSLFVFLAILFSQFTIFPLLSFVSRGDLSDYSVYNSFEYFISSGDFDGFQSVVNVYRMAYIEGLSYGRQILSAIGFFVPRDFWPGKSIGTGGESALVAGYTFINLSAPLPAELYVDFGFFGLVLLTIFFAYFIFRFDRRFNNLFVSRMRFEAIGLSFSAGYMFIFMRGSLIGVLGPLVCSIFIFYIFSLFRKTR